MTTKTDITLPPLPEWSKMDDLGGLVPSEVRVALAGYARAAVEADRQSRMPSEESISGLWRECTQAWNRGKTDTPLVQQFARALLSRYGQPAASAEVAHGLLQQFFDALDDALSRERTSPWTGLKGAKFQDRMLAWNRVQELRRRLLAAPVAQEPVPAQCDVRSIMINVTPGADGEGHEVYAKSVEDVEALLAKMSEELEDWQLGIRRYAAAPVAAQAQPTIRESLKVAQDHDAGLADTQRAIIEAAERRGYARAEAENVGYRTDAGRYREFFEAGLPITFLGIDYHDKPSLDAAIDAARAAKGADHG